MSETTSSSGSYPPAPRVRRAAPVAVTLVQGVSRTITIAGFRSPPGLSRCESGPP